MPVHPFFTIVQQSEAQSLPAAINDLNNCLTLLGQINEVLAQSQIEIKPWQKYLEIQSVKFIFHTSSIVQLLKGTLLEPERKLVHDMGSIFLLKRAQLENYLMFYYLNIQPKSDDEGLLRKFFFDLGGLAHRQGYAATMGEHINQKEKEANEINLLLRKIQSNTYFQTLPLQKRNDLLKKMPPKILGWEQIITTSHLKTLVTIELWRYYSNYAHSEMIGIMQMAEFIKNPDELRTSVYITAEQTLITTCILIEDFFTAFPTLQGMKAGLPLLLKSKIEFWNQVGKE